MSDSNEDGLQQLQAMIEGRSNAAIGEKLGFKLVDAERGQVVVEGTPDRTVYNPMGVVHGGYAATLLDTGCGLAVHSKLGPNLGHTTLELKVSYLRALTDKSGTVRVMGRTISVGRRVAFSEASLHDSQGRLCATATSTLLIFEMDKRASEPQGVADGNAGQ